MIKCVAAIAVGLSGWAPARGADVVVHDRAELGGALAQQVQIVMPDLLRYYQDLHANPELSLQEHRTAEKLAGTLRSAGYEVTTGVGGTGVVAVLRNGSGPTVLIRGDMDALPVTEETGLPYASTVRAKRPDGTESGVMHACGHDVHQAVLAGTGRILAALHDRWRGTLVLIGQPAEEVGRGARMMIDDGLFERFPKPDCCLGLHVNATLPAGSVGYKAGWAHANVDSVDITIFGYGGHGSTPEKTVDPIATAAQVIVTLQTIVSRRIAAREAAVVTVGSIHAGTKHNIIPDQARLQLTVRSYGDEVRRKLLKSIAQITEGVCSAMGCPQPPVVQVDEEEFTPAAYNDPELVRAMVPVLQRVIGADHVVEQPAKMGGEDFGRYPAHLHVPGFMYDLGSVRGDLYQASLQENGPRLPSLHSSKYAPEPEPSILTGVRTMSAAALSVLQRP